VFQNDGSIIAKYRALAFNNIKGKIRISADVGVGSAAKPILMNNLQFATITFSPIAVTSTPSTIKVEYQAGGRNDSNLVLFENGITRSQDVLSTNGYLTFTTNASTTTPASAPDQTTDPTQLAYYQNTTATSATTGSQALNVNYQLQGRTSNEALVEVRYRKANSNIIRTFNAAGNANGTFSMKIDPGSYIFAVRTSGYKWKVTGTDASPVVVSPSTTGFNATTIFAGDFDDTNIVDDNDLKIYLSRYASFNKIMDLDDSGEINGLDYEMMRQNSK
jgi:hypothetical protein